MDSGNSILKSSVEIKVICVDDYETGSLTYNPYQSSLPLNTRWIEDFEGFNPVSMSTQFFFEGNHYQLSFNRNGNLIEVHTNDLALIGNNTMGERSRTQSRRYTDKIDMQLLTENLHQLINYEGGNSNFEALANQRVDIPMTNFFAMRDIGYRVTSEGAIIPLLIYR